LSTNSIPFIRPLSLGELLDQAIGLYRRNFLTFIGIIALPYIPLGMVQAASSFILSSASASFPRSSESTTFPGGSYWLAVLGTIASLILQFILVQGVATAALTRAVADNYTGQPVTIWGAYRKLGASWARLLGALVAVVLIYLVMVVWLVIPCVGWLTGPGMLFFIFTVVSPFIAPVVVLEKQGGFNAFRRAWDLARSRFWWLVGFGMILLLFAQLVVRGPAFLLMSGVNLLFGSQMDLSQQLLITNLIQYLLMTVTSLLYLPLSLAATTVVYFDLRVRSEGLDLALQAAGEFNENVNIVSLAETSPATQSAFITGTDVGYFLLLTLVGVAFYALLMSLSMGLLMAMSPSF
jgi:hypothetical protein